MPEPRPSRSPRQPPQSEEELRARIEEQLRTVRVQDLLLESVVSVLNLSARRIAKDDERDLEQAQGRDRGRAGDGRPARPPSRRSRSERALSEVQVLYARQARAESPSAEADGERHPSRGEARRASREAARPARGGPQRPRRSSGRRRGRERDGCARAAPSVPATPDGAVRRSII